MFVFAISILNFDAYSFEYAVLPCRTLCCGKVFCTEHLADWLHGPEAEGRCPNCENACSLAGGTLSLASPTERSSLQAKRNKLAQAIHSSSSTPVQPQSNDTMTNLRDELHPQVASTNSTSSTSTSSYSSTIDYSETTVSAEESKEDDQHHIHHPFQNERISPPWGVASRIISILIFLMFLYKLRS
jgi:ABC-type Na+ efflux pump permease subunit